MKSKRVYKCELGFAALAFINATADREISGRELQKHIHEKLHINVSIRER